MERTPNIRSENASGACSSYTDGNNVELLTSLAACAMLTSYISTTSGVRRARPSFADMDRLGSYDEPFAQPRTAGLLFAARLREAVGRLLDRSASRVPIHWNHTTLAQLHLMHADAPEQQEWRPVRMDQTAVERKRCDDEFQGVIAEARRRARYRVVLHMRIATREDQLERTKRALQLCDQDRRIPARTRGRLLWQYGLLRNEQTLARARFDADDLFD